MSTITEIEQFEQKNLHKEAFYKLIDAQMSEKVLMNKKTNRLFNQNEYDHGRLHSSMAAHVTLNRKEV
jgi:hypothetical protein